MSRGENESVGVFFPRRLLRSSLCHLCRDSLFRSTGRAFALPSGARLQLFVELSRSRLRLREEAAKVAVTTCS